MSFKVYKQKGRNIAKRLFPIPDILCEFCHTRQATDHHHKDGDTWHNYKDNIMFLCRSCHLKLDHASGLHPNQTRLTVDQIERIKDKRNRIKDLQGETGLSIRYLYRIREGSNNPVPRDKEYQEPVVPDGWHPKPHGKPRVLDIWQVKHLLSHQPHLAVRTAKALAQEYSVNVSTIWKAYGRQGCYGDKIYD